MSEIHVIRVITEPSIYLVGRQAVDRLELARFLTDNISSAWTTDAPSSGEELVEVAGRLCYDSFRKPRPGGSAAYISHILEVGHGSVVEHCVFSVIITGISRTLSHELIRHRVGLSPSQLSQRYVDASGCAFVVPPAYVESVTAARRFIVSPFGESGGDVPAECHVGIAWIESCRSSLSAYRLLMDDRPGDPTFGTAARKAAREAARSVLPGCVETKIFLTGNARAWRHFLELRGSRGADAEIRRLALALLPVLRAEAPHLFGDYRVVEVDGVETIHTDHRKV